MGVCALFVGVIDVIVVATAGRVVASTVPATSCTANAVGRGGNGGYSGVDSESTSTLVYDVRALADM